MRTMIAAAIAVMVASGAAAEGVPIPPDVVMQAPYTGPSREARATGDGWVSYTPVGCITYYDDLIKETVTMLSTAEGRWFGATRAGSVAAFNTACATSANMMFYMTPANNSWTQFLIQPGSKLSR